jgi:hypothetical protein
MTPEEILKIDAKRNHDGIEVKSLIGYINHEIRSGAQLVQENDTLVLFKSVKDDKAEFHTFNAGSAADLAKNVELFLQMLKKMGYKAAYTEYESPLISKLFMTYNNDRYKVNITKGEDSSFRAEVTL